MGFILYPTLEAMSRTSKASCAVIFFGCGSSQRQGFKWDRQGYTGARSHDPDMPLGPTWPLISEIPTWGPADKKLIQNLGAQRCPEFGPMGW